MTRAEGKIPDPGGRPPLGGRPITVRIPASLAAAIDRRTAAAIRAGTAETVARSRTLRTMLAEGAELVGPGEVPCLAGDGSESRETFTVDGRLAERIDGWTADVDLSDAVRGLLALSLDYAGPAIEPDRPWREAYLAALDAAGTGEQADAVRARLEHPDATERQLADMLRVSVAAYKSRVQRALKRIGKP